VLLARAGGLEGFARHVVIKRIHPDLTREERFVSAFVEEARISASLHHQNIVQVHDIGDEGGSIFFAMEYVHGEDVRKLINKVRERGEMVPLQHVVAIVMATAAGLHYAHEQVMPTGENKGIVHRDMSPANILIGYDGSVKIVDFGLARAAQRSTSATQSGTLKGKSSYMSPEQCTGRAVDRRTDTFSLGIVLFELLTAQRLFKGANEFMTMAAIVDGEIPRPSSLRPDIPSALDEIVLRALSRAPESRYQTAEALRESLEAFSLAQELRTSAKALADYLASLFGERQEPWLADRKPDPQWEEVEATHAGLVAVPKDPKSLIQRFSTDIEDSPLKLAQSLGAGDWNEDDEAEATGGQLPSLKRAGQPTEPTQTLRKPVVNPNVRPRASEPPVAKKPAEVTEVLPVNDQIRRLEPPMPDNSLDAPTVRPGELSDAAATHNLNRSELLAEANKHSDLATQKQRPIAKGDMPGSSTLVEPPIFDGGIPGRADDDDGLDEDEPATEIALDAPVHVPDPPKEKVPLALRRPPRVERDELPRAPDVVPAPLRPVARVQLPNTTSAGMGALGAPREVTPPGSPPAPMRRDPSAASIPAAERRDPSVASIPSARGPSFAGVDPASVAAGFQPRANSEAMYQSPPAPPESLGSEGLGGFRAGRLLLIVGISAGILVATIVGMRSCEKNATTTPAAAPLDADVETDEPSDAAVTPATRDAGVRRDAGTRDAGTRDAGTADAGAGSATKNVAPPKRPVKRIRR